MPKRESTEAKYHLFAVNIVKRRQRHAYILWSTDADVALSRARIAHQSNRHGTYIRRTYAGSTDYFSHGTHVAELTHPAILDDPICITMLSRTIRDGIT